jgi:hypothetical protein
MVTYSAQCLKEAGQMTKAVVVLANPNALRAQGEWPGDSVFGGKGKVKTWRARHAETPSQELG